MSLPAFETLRRGLIVSVQAPEGSPMRHPQVIAAMAEASLCNGAVGVRLESPEHIGAVRRRCPDALIIGLWKRSFSDSAVYITPGWEEVEAVWSAGADVVALDATQRHRPGGITLEQLVSRVREDLGAPLMADVDTIENGYVQQSLVAALWAPLFMAIPKRLLLSGLQVCVCWGRCGSSLIQMSSSSAKAGLILLR